jgi:uncharacterized lipoprotein NlpE involved in copper resistance
MFILQLQMENIEKFLKAAHKYGVPLKSTINVPTSVPTWEMVARTMGRFLASYNSTVWNKLVFGTPYL